MSADLIPSGPRLPCNEPDVNPEAFFPPVHTNPANIPALDLCRRCPAIRICLAYALTHDVLGIWGGTTERQRDELRRVHHVKAEPVTLPDPRMVEIDAMERGGGVGETDRKHERPLEPDHPALPNSYQERT